MTGRYQTYSEYKESGVEYLNRIPNHWKALPMHSLVTECDRSNKGMIENNLLSLSYGRIIQKNIDTLDGLLPASFETYQIVKPNDIVFRLTDLQNDKRSLRSAIVNERGIITSAYTAVSPNKINPRYLSWLMRSYDTWKVFYGMGGGLRQALKFDELKRLPISTPPTKEQHQIARFLDYETTRIDQLITKQERLIELLKEKRQAVISHAVTKGLDPDAPMKDSGVEWLGEVPEHWVVTRAKMVSEIFVPQRNKPDLNESGNGVHWATMEDMKYDEINETQKYVSTEAFKIAGSKILRKGAVVASCVGNFGVASVLNIDVVINQQLQAYIPKTISGLYLRDLITCSKVYFDLVGTAATLVYVNQEGFGNIPIPLPPIVEQREIEQHVEQSKANFNQAIAKGEQQIKLLQERRTALISAAVTGKIDVRNWEPPTTNDKDAA